MIAYSIWQAARGSEGAKGGAGGQVGQWEGQRQGTGKVIRRLGVAARPWAPLGDKGYMAARLAMWG